MTVARIPAGSGALSRPGERRKSLLPLALAALGLVGLAMVPMGSNRPVFWALWPAVLFAALAWGLTRAPSGTLSRRLARAQLCGPVALALGGVALVLLQSLPMPGLGPAPSLDAWASLLGAMRLGGFAALFLIVLFVASRDSRIRWMQTALFWIVCVQAAYALVALTILGDVGPWGGKAAYHGVATGSYVNRNALAACLGMGVILGLSLALAQDEARAPARSGWLRRLPLFLGLGLMMAALLSTGSRAGMASTAIGILVLCTRMRFLPRGRMLLAGMAGLAVLGFVFGGVLAGRLLDLLAAPPDRLVLWGQVLPMLADRPLWGAGLDTFEQAFRPYHGPGLRGTVIWDHAHNSYLALWAERGLIGGTAPVLAAAWVGWRLCRVQPDPRARARRAMGVAVLVQAGLHATVDFSFEIAANLFLLLALVALAAAVPRSAVAPVQPGKT